MDPISIRKIRIHEKLRKIIKIPVTEEEILHAKTNETVKNSFFYDQNSPDYEICSNKNL